MYTCSICSTLVIVAEKMYKENVHKYQKWQVYNDWLVRGKPFNLNVWNFFLGVK